MKCCIDCKESKPLDHFKVNRSKPDGHADRCKACSRDRQKAIRENPKSGYKDPRPQSPVGVLGYGNRGSFRKGKLTGTILS